MTTKTTLRVRLRRFLRCSAYAMGGFTLLLLLASIWIYARADAHVLSDLRRRTVNDITQLNPIQVGRVATPRSTEEVSELLAHTEGPVSIGGARCSMGGQTAEEGSLHLDLRQMNKVLSLSPKEHLVTVQTGIRWRDLQKRIDPHNLSIAIMQTYASFSVGGTLSVNAHGRYMGRGPVVQSVRAIKVVLADGQVIEASPQLNPEVFYGAIGGYGGLGVITEATLELADNVKVERVTETMGAAEYPAFFRAKVRDDSQVVFHNADLHPPDFDTLRAISWRETTRELTESARLIPEHDDYSFTPFIINNMMSLPLGVGHALRKHLLEPVFYAFDAVTYRNHEASYDVRELEPDRRDETTFVLREYFVPAEKFKAFLPRMREIFRKHDVKVANISVRHASADPGTLLSWARGETFAFVVYYEQGTTAEAIREVQTWSRELVDAVIAVGGTYYLPYQNHPTRAQFLRAYPRAEEFFALKRKLDPSLRFQNSLWHSYGPSPQAELEHALRAVPKYQKPEGQSILTVPEWYLVFNPVEYADHLARGRASDDFPFAASAEEYWSQYKKVLALNEGSYPENEEYLTMLRVIGVSTTVEYLVKAAYENTFGKFTRVLSSGRESQEDVIIAQAQRAYSELIFHEPWYKFAFMPWVSKIWRETSLWGADFVRRTERKLSFSAEFAVKAVYAKVIAFGAQSAYDTPEERVQLVVKTAEPTALTVDPRVIQQKSLSADTYLISVPRWGPFSEILPKLAARGVSFVDIAGNDDIAMSLVVPAKQKLDAAWGQPLFDAKVVSHPGRKRSVLFVPVRDLAGTLRSVESSGLRVEHLYDY